MSGKKAKEKNKAQQRRDNKAQRKTSANYLKDSKGGRDQRQAAAKAGLTSTMLAPLDHSGPVDPAYKDQVRRQTYEGAAGFNRASEATSRLTRHMPYEFDHTKPVNVLITESFNGPGAARLSFGGYTLNPVEGRLKIKPCFLVAQRVGSEWVVTRYVGISGEDQKFHGSVEEVGRFYRSEREMVGLLAGWCKQYGGDRARTGVGNYMFPEARRVSAYTNPYATRMDPFALFGRSARPVREEPAYRGGGYGERPARGLSEGFGHSSEGRGRRGRDDFDLDGDFGDSFGSEFIGGRLGRDRHSSPPPIAFDRATVDENGVSASMRAYLAREREKKGAPRDPDLE